MAEIAYTKPDKGPSHRVYLWDGATSGDTFAPVYMDRTPYSLSFQIEDADAWAATPSVAIHGSLDGVTYYALQDYDKTDIAVTADGFVVVGEVPLYLRPVVTSGDSGTDLTVRMLARFDSK